MGNQNNNEGKFLERLSIFISNMIISVITVMTVAVIPSCLFVRDTGWEPDVPPCGGDGYQGNDSVQCECRLQKKKQLPYQQNSLSLGKYAYYANLLAKLLHNLFF